MSSLIRAATPSTPSDGATASTLGCVTSWLIGAMSFLGSYGSFENRRVLIASGPPMLMPMVEPSGTALATASVPRLPLAPGLFSTTKALPGYLRCHWSAMSRATVSGVDPAPNGT